MADWHFEELQEALQRRGAQRYVESPGDGYQTSGTWELRRSRDERVFFLDFDGFTHDESGLPMEKSVGVTLRGTFLYLPFGRRRARHLWVADLAAILEALETST